MNLHSLVYTPINGGTLAGFLAVELVHGGQLGLSARQLSGKLEDAVKQFNLRQPLLRVVIPNLADVEDKEMASTLVVARDKGYLISIESDGTERPNYFNFASHLIVKLDAAQSDWLQFTTREIRYSPSNVIPWTEPAIGRNNEGSSCYVVPPSSALQQLIGFLSIVTRPWGVILTPRQSLAINLLEVK